jgi:multiple sugar transport system ATP-binding protein
VARLRPHAGKAAWLGIRPENLFVAGEGGDYAFDTVAEVVEQLGAEILLDARVGAQTIVASIDPTQKIRTGDKVRLTMNPDRVHFFDGLSEQAI